MLIYQALTNAMNRAFLATNGVDFNGRKAYIGKMEKQGPTVLTRANGERLVCVPTGKNTFRIFRLDGRQFFVLEDYEEKEAK